MRPSRPSLTATLVAGVRALYAAFPEGLRAAPDPEVLALLPPVLRVPARAVAAFPWLSPPVHKALGAVTLGVTWHVALRTLAIDDAVREAVSLGTRQIVLLGAGLDNRAGRLPEVSTLRVFEIDHPDMQSYKRERIHASFAGAGQRVFVPVNFESDSLSGALSQAGFSSREPAFWIWEGVTPYLTRQAVLATLRTVFDQSAPGSRLAVTYMRPAEDTGQAFDRLTSFLGALIGEPVFARYGREEMAQLVTELGFSLLSDEADTDFAARYWKDPPDVRPRSMHLFPEWERLAIVERGSP